MKNLKLITILLLAIFVFACKKESTNNNEQEKITINGEVKLPSGSLIEINGCNVNSFWTEQTLTSKDYEVEVNKNDFNVQFLSDKNDKTVMLGYSYPNQTDFTIDANSTILGLLMKVPSINNLADAQKIEFIRDIKNNIKYADALSAVETHIKNGLDIFDTTDVVMQQKLSALFDNNVLRRRGGFGYDKQIYITRDSLNLTFGNPGVSFVQVVGIYDNTNTRIAKLEIDRHKMYVTSIFDIPNAIFTTPNLIETKYTLPSNGTYKIKVRNGGFNPINNDLESEEALISNSINLVLDNIKVFIPLDVSSGCNSAIYNSVKSKIDAIKPIIKATNNKVNFISLIYNITKSTIYDLKIGTACSNINLPIGQQKFIDKISFYIKWIDLVGKTGTYMNNTVFTFEYFTSNTQNPSSVLDTTITVGQDSTVTDIDGNIYHTVRIGTQVWMKENLKTTRYKDGTTIPTGLSNAAWQATTSGAYAIYNNNAANNTTYGKLYNWYAVNTGKLAPAGWHVPTDAEWTTLINYLGGEAVAGGKMKATTLWSSPNTGATNSSGFTGLPAGAWDGSFFNNIGNTSLFCSSTEFGTYNAFVYDLHYNSSGFYSGVTSKVGGFSVRCVKD
jgi:uncharacterized protein (TIGR02145 family)